MDKTQVNPWTWQDAFGFSQCWTVAGAQKVHYLSGQTAIGADGHLVGDGDFEAQATQALENLQAVLAAAGATFQDVVKLTVYLTDTAKMMDYGRIKNSFIEGPQPASTVIGVAALALPQLMIEIEAIAVT